MTATLEPSRRFRCATVAGAFEINQPTRESHDAKQQP